MAVFGRNIVSFMAAAAMVCGGYGAAAVKQSVSKKDEPPMVITSKGKMVLNYGEQKTAEFNTEVVLRDKSGTLEADKLTVYFMGKTEDESTIKKAIAEGHVKMRTSDSRAESGKAVFFADKNVIKLYENPVIYRGKDAYKAEIITIYRAEDRVVFEPSAQLVIFDNSIQAGDGKGKTK